MDRYKIIHNEDKLLDFIEWLPNPKKDELLMYGLYARRKYLSPENRDIMVSSDSNALTFGYCRTKSKLIHKIRSLEAPLGSYRSDHNQLLPQEALYA